jgi:hypothetical protein
MTLWSLVYRWVQDSWQIWGRCPRKRLIFSLDATVFQAEIFVNLACAKGVYMKGLYR